MGRLSTIPQIEARIGKPLSEYLKEHLESGEKPGDIATAIGTSQSQVYQFIKDCRLKDVIKLARKRKSGAGSGELEKYVADYNAEKKRAGMTDETIQKTKDIFHNYLWWLEHTNRPTSLEYSLALDTLNKFWDYLQTETQRFSKQFSTGASSGTIIVYRKTIAAFKNWLIKMELVPPDFKDPFKKMMPIKKRIRLPEDMPDELIMKAINSFGDDFEGIRNKTLVEWFLETGMRLDGVANVKMNQFDWQTGKGKIVEKGEKERLIILSDRLKMQIIKYLPAREPIAKCDSVWITGKGTPLAEHSIWKIFNTLHKKFKDDIARLCPGERIHPHLFRHIWTKHLVQSEVPGYATMEMAGWANLDLVMYYAAAYNKDKAWSYINTASPLSKLEKENGNEADKPNE